MNFSQIHMYSCKFLVLLESSLHASAGTYINCIAMITALCVCVCVLISLTTTLLYRISYSTLLHITIVFTLEYSGATLPTQTTVGQCPDY